MPDHSSSTNGVAGESMTEVVARYLREAINEGKFAPGAAVRQEAVAKELGVSRIPVREALRRLESEGLVVTRPNSGARVAFLDFEEYADIYKMRERLEPLALSESIPRLTSSQIEDIERNLERLFLLEGQPAAFLEADRQFHLSCYVSVPTTRLLKMIEGFWATTQRHRRALLLTWTPEDYSWTNWEHRLIFDAIKTGNTRVGEEAIRMHIERTRLRLAGHTELFDR
ncbi:GntR family transcriptional regulator [Agromyces bauzanensis]